jgi:SAM-dependent methyltransferase
MRRAGSPLWTERTVAWYERAQHRSDYAERVLEASADVLTAARSLLDVGAGFGALAVPLARRLAHVTALEPTATMAAALRRAIRRDGITNLTVVEAAWGGAPVSAHDVVLCAQVGRLLARGSAFLADVARVAAHGVVLVRDTPGRDDKFFYGELYPRLLGRPYTRTCEDMDTVAGLGDLGIVPDVTTIEYRSDQPFESLDEACDFWMTYMGLTGEAPRRFLHDFLTERLQREGDGWVAAFSKRATVIRWRV